MEEARRELVYELLDLTKICVRERKGANWAGGGVVFIFRLRLLTRCQARRQAQVQQLGGLQRA